MKTSINLNVAWTKTFVARLEKLGVREVCISPGSRNTPLTLAFAESKKIKSLIFVDERASAFFALGMAKKNGRPVAVVTTSGTATAELYPAIIEAYQTCAPLIVCTADRPAYLRETGANQTINQENIYKNHIVKFIDAGLPKLTATRLERLIKNTDEAFFTALKKGPVHLNFPFEKPLEPQTKNVKIEKDFLKKFPNREIKKNYDKERKIGLNVLKKIRKSAKTLILLGGNLPAASEKAIVELAKRLKAPLVADGISSARFSANGGNVIAYGVAIFKSGESRFSPDLIISFGKAPTSNVALEFFGNSDAYKILINSKGKKHDPTRTHDLFLSVDEKTFAEFVKANVRKREHAFLSEYKKAEQKIEKFAEEFFRNSDLKFEGKVARCLSEILPIGANLFIGNSMPPRDFDFFSGKRKKRLKIFANRGASGIDGIISTAAGTAYKSKARTFLYVGDLSFYYDLTFLHYLKKLNVPLTVILQNNNGGGIFNMLPVAEREEKFEEFFITPLDFNFGEIIRSFEIQYFIAEDETEFREAVENTAQNNLAVIEIKTDAKYSTKLRKEFFDKATGLISKN